MESQKQIAINPVIDKEALRNLEINMMEMKHSGYKIDRCKMVRALIDKFNKNPEATLKYIGINK